MDDDYFLLCLRKGRSRFGGSGKLKKKNIKLAVAVFILSVGIFFYALMDKSVLIDWEINPEKPEITTLDPLNRIDRGFFRESCENQQTTLLCQGMNGEIKSLEENKILEMVAGHPIEKMAPYIAKKDGQIASFLLAIAKKESNWGKHSPKKIGQACYNYWGYKGGYRQTGGGYSCFDSPEQAVEIVGQRISNLIDKRIDTPSEMVVWKCGSSCVGHEPQAVKKWIADVGLYYRKFN
jgi:hypothetical protein